ncbi:hypothetical protein DSO57_1020158 [Entomophthora muscae]|uniref:Uncharacterized protein n=1 Tax=Entomophthora muscae TaxID=34485 RepID=A0ACC2RIF1_9FUNG|nr:hypothetical protein DSO57_1020158 [Entomophthora muscae]
MSFQQSTAQASGITTQGSSFYTWQSSQDQLSHHSVPTIPIKIKVENKKDTPKRYRVSDDLRQLVLAKHADGETNLQISKSLKIARQTVYSIIQKTWGKKALIAEAETKDKRVNPYKGDMVDLVKKYLDFNPGLGVRDLHRLLGCSGYSISERTVSGMREGLSIGFKFQEQNPVERGLLPNPLEREAVKKFLQNDSGTKSTGVIFVSYYLVEIHVKSFGKAVEKYPDGNGIGSRAFFSLFLAICGDGFVFFESERYVSELPNFNNILERFLKSRALEKSRIILLSHSIPNSFNAFNTLAANNHSVMLMPAAIANGHLGDAVSFNLPRYILSLNPTTRDNIEQIITKVPTSFPFNRITELYHESLIVAQGGESLRLNLLPPRHGIVPKPLEPPSKERYLECLQCIKSNQQIPRDYEFESSLNENSAMFLPF